MVPYQKKMPTGDNGKDQRSANFKAFIEGKQGAGHPEWKQEKATGTNNFVDQQNKLIDQHNLRK